MLDKTFDAADVEPRITERWEKAGAFRAGAGAGPGAAPFSIVIPPPNVTGSLHIGHALNNTLQDVLVRFERMRGRDVLWQPGMDHAGIATQMVVERQMIERQEPNRHQIGRGKFIEKVWAWKAESGGQIINQLKRLGASCDWSRERFTMDEGLSRAVTKVFVELYRQGLIYKDKRLVNWDPALRTAISDLEVEQVETRGKLWHFKYPIEGEAGRFIVVATTRPETMLGDTGVAVHPDDERYKDLVGRYAVLPLVGRRLRIVADEYADPKAGTGAVKITPAHDFNDFEVGKRHGLPAVSIFTPEAKIKSSALDDFTFGHRAPDPVHPRVTYADEDGLEGPPTFESIPEELRGLDRFEARKRVVAMMEERGLVAKVEDHVHSVPHGDRGGVPIEPYLTEQWYADAKTLAAPAIAAVRDGRTVFVPKSWEKTYFDWMENIQPWCISRQLWWGHQIPAWYGPDGTVFVAETEAEAQASADGHYGSPTPLRRDEDVLDTWFSSALWPFSTLGWPDDTPELRRYYPTSVLVTAFDIIFFWVARMMMFGLHFMKEVPFRDVYIHALVRDAKGAKMSKSKGNIIDPLVLIDKYGADALRFTLAAMAAQGRDIKLAESRVEGYRNFATKLWNAARFAEHYDCRRVEGFEPSSARETLNRWILTEASRATREVTAGIEAYRFNEAAAAIYRFTWNLTCDWYLELAKPVLGGEDGPAKDETRATVAYVLDRIVALLHPFMPFITEELWGRGGERPLLALSPWPEPGFEDDSAAGEINWLIELISAIRSVRSEMNVPAAALVPLSISGAYAETLTRIRTHEVAIRRLARSDAITIADMPLAGAVQVLCGEAIVSLPLAGIVDLAAEHARLSRDAEKTRKEIAKIDAKLGNEAFIAKAPEEVIEEQRERREEALATLARTEEALARLSGYLPEPAK
jgi:valyl-tRNA synthetase